ncbi:unnamed protein product [Pelagomonas calceolata]|uniref:Uncharacterized protein n=1 Tax=Pelagomonas calceolata TaxID=35677 RepID=A0A8J2SC34_9STRA|nr:unnamed protein product [Pelagomonas calceolata]|mmetsp:Transcript_4094/g.11965  ORF Transcript_4094/g.11965 Transcript_4094/m.11965 type:complete len:252 (-) Transcript_4094:14-769(-)
MRLRASRQPLLRRRLMRPATPPSRPLSTKSRPPTTPPTRGSLGRPVPLSSIAKKPSRCRASSATTWVYASSSTTTPPKRFATAAFASRPESGCKMGSTAPSLKLTVLLPSSRYGSKGIRGVASRCPWPNLPFASRDCRKRWLSSGVSTNTLWRAPNVSDASTTTGAGGTNTPASSRTTDDGFWVRCRGTRRRSLRRTSSKLLRAWASNIGPGRGGFSATLSRSRRRSHASRRIGVRPTRRESTAFASSKKL